MRNIPHGLMHFKTLSLADGAVWEGYGTFRRQSLARKRRVWGVGDLAPLPVCFLLLWPRLPCHYGASPLEPEARVNSSLHNLFLIMETYHHNRGEVIQM